MNKNISLILILLGCIKLFSQDPEKYQEVYMKTYLEVSKSDFEEALEIADSLFQTSETPLFKTRSLMLTASLYVDSGDLQKAINYALLAEKHIENTDDYAWRARVSGFLASQYRQLKLYNESKKYAEKAFEVAQKIEDPELGNNTMGLIKQEAAYSYYANREYEKAIEELNQALRYLQAIEYKKDFLLADIEQMLGKCYYKLEEFDESLKYYKTAMVRFEENEGGDHSLRGQIYNGLGAVYLAKGEMNLAYENLELAYGIAESSNNMELKLNVYGSMMDYYTEMEDINQLLKFKNKQDSLNAVLAKSKMNYVDESFSNLKSTNESIRSKVSKRNYIIGIVSLITLSLSVLFLIYRNRQKKNIEHFKQIIAKLDSEERATPSVLSEKEDEQVEINGITIDEVVADSKAEETTKGIPTDTEARILKKLENFESSTKFIKNSISLASLAIYCETNTKYLSHIINTHKEKDFNNYINELRVNYIIKKLKNEPIYRKYKIATLAEESGFSSQNKFSTIFKKVTSISPSVFIKLLDEEKV